MAQPSDETRRRHDDYVVVLTRLFIEAFNARDHQAMRALVSEDVELRGPNASSLRGYPGIDELLETAAHLDLVILRTALEGLSEDDGATRVTVPIRELTRGEELFRTAAFRVADHAIASYETLTND